MKALLLSIVSICVLFAGNTKEAATALHPGKQNRYHAAIERAKVEKKMLVMVIVKENCPWCHKLLRKTLADTEVKKALENTIVLIVDKDASYPSAFKVTLFPSIFYIDYASETSVYENVGYVDTKEFLLDLRESIKTRDALYREEERPEERP